jgi:oligopeptide transport system ATP-binding protein
VSALLRVEDLAVRYSVEQPGLLRRQRQVLRAVESVSFELGAGETLGIVGETGCGKSSLGKAILQLVPASAGRVWWDGVDLCRLTPPELRARRRDLQIIFQDPLSSLDPRQTVGEIVAEPLKVHFPDLTATERERRVTAMLERVGLRADMRSRYPHEFSGGQCQRISIARAMISQPRLVVCDEPVSSLDVSIQAQICNLLRDLQRETGISLIFISHDLSVVRYMSQRVLVLYLGRVMELATREALFNAPRHPYTRALLNAVPVPDPERPLLATAAPLAGELPSPLDPPSGCVFRTRCPRAVPVCITQLPVLERVGDRQWVACHRVGEAGV